MAIAFNAVTAAKTVLTVSSITYAHDVGSGANRFLSVTQSWNDNGTGAIEQVGATYNGDAMTLVAGADAASGAVELYLYQLANPDSGSNNVVVTRDVSVLTQYDSFAQSYTGVNQAAPVDVFNEDALTASSDDPFTISVTTTVENTWIVGAASEDQGLIANGPAGANTTYRESPQYNQQGADSGGARASGANALNWERNSPVAGNLVGVIMAIKPAAGGAAVVHPTLLLMSVG